ncbi:serine protease family protein [Haladaptatus cibarius]|uniref:trypsin-like peptidase domain-containing protein n=1 Tax=Haladaptatus cibarius TaxID=453847 RepID=UPI000678F2A0|nr:trypsin-like peptidase domain-containing protein [Haladaptatus cibarius]
MPSNLHTEKRRTACHSFTRDVHGNPETVRIVPKERYRRLKVYEKMDIAGLLDKHPVIRGVGIEQQSKDETDLAIQLRLDGKKNTLRAQSALPNRIQQTPITTTEQEGELVLEGDCDGGSRDNQTVDPVEGCAGIYVRIPDGYIATGTACLAGYDADTNDPMILTCWHVADEKIDKYLYQNGRKVGVFSGMDTGMDAAKYRATDAVDVRDTLEPNLKEITGTWDFSGLTDAVAWGATVGGYYGGRKTCYAYSSCYDTERNARVDYQAEFSDHPTTGGDSGGPWVDYDGKLICMHQGYFTNWDGEHCRGMVGTELLDAIGMTLY